VEADALQTAKYTVDDMSAMERALMRAQPPIHRSNSMNGPLRRDLSKEQKRQMQADISPENVRVCEYVCVWVSAISLSRMQPQETHLTHRHT